MNAARAAPVGAPPAPADLVTEVLEEYGLAVRRRMGEFMAARKNGHVPYLYDLARDYPERGGRSLRPSLCIATARAFGASVEDALNSAVALEILHNAFLIHDDIEDLSETRRGKPTLHLLHGVPIAINVGDAMSVLGLRPLIENRRALGGLVTLRILEEAEAMARETVEGQAMELGWRRDHRVDITDADYLRMILKKTCWYTTIFPLRVGAIIGARDNVDLDPLLRFGFFLGAAFQITDDVLNLVGDPARYGKEIDGDLWEGKRTLMLVHLLSMATAHERVHLEAFLRLPRQHKTSRDVRWVRRLIDRYRCVEDAQRTAHGLAGAAAHEFAQVFGGLPNGRDKDFVGELSRWVIGRK